MLWLYTAYTHKRKEEKDLQCGQKFKDACYDLTITTAQTEATTYSLQVSLGLTEVIMCYKVSLEK